MNHYKEKTRSVQLTRTKTPPHQPSNAKTKIKSRNAPHEKQAKSARPHKHRHTVPAQFRFRSIKKAATRQKKKTIVRRPPIPTFKNTPHAQSPLFQRLRAAPARAKPPVNFVLDRQGRKSVKTREPTASNAKKRQATLKAYKKNEQSTAKKDILRKTNRQDTQNSINNTKSTDLKQKKNKRKADDRQTTIKYDR